MNVILVILDSLRMDHMGCCADCYPEPSGAKTPNLDRLAAESLRFRKAAPESLPTLPMRRAVHTGQRVWPYWVHRSYKGDFKGAPGWGPMQEEQDSVAELLRNADYRTGFVTDTYHQFKASKNFHRGFDEWHWIRGQESDPYRSGPTISDERVLRHIPKSLLRRRRKKSNAHFIERHRQYLMNVAERKSDTQITLETGPAGNCPVASSSITLRDRQVCFESIPPHRLATRGPMHAIGRGLTSAVC